jgi:acetyl esterase/lipase
MPSALLISPRPLLLLALSLSAAGLTSAQTPTHANVPYGNHERQVLDFWQAKSDNAQTPLLFFVHGGGWMTGDKATPDFLAQCLANGISVVSINYRLIQDAQAAQIDPPVQACLDDAARALQFVRRRRNRHTCLRPAQHGSLCGQT